MNNIWKIYMTNKKEASLFNHGEENNHIAPIHEKIYYKKRD
jgi:hypothetical protein